ncbi:Sporulation kinase E [Rubripirellula obstinata]|uniref:histidine kinase n=1 Tax=Rubripirellula obstinata TaxID=406547 RepID=A0A5B1CMR2_9BACT|nr:ATP-binding protein [Rubripirellula obstinata]KAA1261205.1 Sporulation kinase E [Rubripirellula obstinata]
MASLFVVRGRDQGKHFQLSRGAIKIGRDRNSEIQLSDSESSRHHAEIHSDSTDGFELVDLNSSNGTRVNGKAIDRVGLASGDRIEIGSTLLIFTGTTHTTSTSSLSSSEDGSRYLATGSRIRSGKEMEAAHGVDIVQKSQVDASRIVSSLSQAGVAPFESPVQSLADDQGPQSQDQQRHLESGLNDADRSLEVMYLTAIAVGRTDDLGEVLNRVLRLVFDWVEADRGCIMLRDNESDDLRAAARCDRDDAKNSVRGKPISISQTILQWVMEKKQGVRTSDARDDVRFDAAASIVTAGVREALCVPLQGRYGIVGALYVDTYTTPGNLIASGNKKRFNDDHLRLITAIGHQAALAIEDTTYYSALVQSERLAVMGQTIATLSHHIKNILQGISGGSYLIESGLGRDDTDAVRRGWSIVDRNQERISNLVMDMLTFSKEREPERVDADLNETVHDVLELMQARAGELGVELGSDLGTDLPVASFDQDGMHRAIMNLVTNAIDAASGMMAVEDDFDSDDSEDQEIKESPKVFVQTTFDPKTGWMIDVVDNGPGVAPEDREKIFSLFESRKGMRGTGLGLPVSAKIMREHGGEIDIVQPENVSGTCFRLRLPPIGTRTSEMENRKTLS